MTGAEGSGVCACPPPPTLSSLPGRFPLSVAFSSFRASPQGAKNAAETSLVWITDAQEGWVKERVGRSQRALWCWKVGALQRKSPLGREVVTPCPTSVPSDLLASTGWRENACVQALGHSGRSSFSYCLPLFPLCSCGTGSWGK